MTFKIYNSSFGIVVEGVRYEFPHVDSLTIDDPKQNRITRGANATDKIGLVYTEGSKEPARVTVTILGMSQALKSVLDTCFNEKKRVDSVYCIDKSDGSGKLAKNAILCQLPQQLNIDESPESMNVSLIFESFDLSENHKS